MDSVIPRRIDDSISFSALNNRINALISQVVIKASSVVELKSYPDNYANRQATLTADGTIYFCVYNTSDLTAAVAADPTGLIYITPASAPSGSTGAWVKTNFRGLLIVTGRVTVDLPSIAIGAMSTIQTTAVTGAVIGDAVRVTAQTYLGDFISCTGEVSSANTVKWYVRNNSGAAIDLPSTTFNVDVFKRS